MILFELERIYKTQYYLECMYKCIFSLAYYGLLRIRELTCSPHVIKASNVNIAMNKEKILIILFSLKTHASESLPQEIKITSNASSNTVNNKVKYRHRNFCPLKITRKYLSMRGNYDQPNEQFFIFRDKSPVYPNHVRKTLHLAITAIGLKCHLYDCHSFRGGQCSELIKLGYPIEVVKRLGRWRSNAVYRYIKN